MSTDERTQACAADAAMHALAAAERSRPRWLLLDVLGGHVIGLYDTEQAALNAANDDPFVDVYARAPHAEVNPRIRDNPASEGDERGNASVGQDPGRLPAVEAERGGASGRGGGSEGSRGAVPGSAAVHGRVEGAAVLTQRRGEGSAALVETLVPGSAGGLREPQANASGLVRPFTRRCVSTSGSLTTRASLLALICRAAGECR